MNKAANNISNGDPGEGRDDVQSRGMAAQPSAPVPEIKDQSQGSSALFWFMQHDFLGALVIALVIALLTMALDWALLRVNWNPMGLALISDGILGVIAFLILWRYLHFLRQQQLAIVARLEVIDQMNHHIRNALQVITFGAASRGDHGFTEVKEGLDRIHWTLRELLPRLEPHYEPLERTPRELGKR